MATGLVRCRRFPLTEPPSRTKRHSHIRPFNVGLSVSLATLPSGHLLSPASMGNMNPSSHPHLSVNQQERSSSRREARLRLSLKNVQWQLPPFPSFPEPAEHQACWTKNSYYLETTIWVQEDDTSASRSHVT